MSAPGPPRLPAGASRYGWFVAVVGLLLVAYVSLNTLRTESVGSQGLKIGAKVPPFAAPLALGTIDGDVNVARKPNQGSAGARPACSVRGPQILNSCQLAERGPVVLAFTAARSNTCDRQIDVLQRVRASYPDVQFAAVSIRGNRDDLRALIQRRGWTLPVAYDHDGGVANAYAVAICPTVTFAYRGGKVQGTSLTLIEGAALRARIEALRRGP